MRNVAARSRLALEDKGANADSPLWFDCGLFLASGKRPILR